jgi:ATP-binding cassette, subfamily B, bacterial
MFSAEVQVMVSFMRDSSMTGQRLRRGSLRRMLSYARSYRRQIGVYLVMTVLSAAILTAIPLLLQVIVDHGILRRDTAVVLWTAGIVAGLAVVNALLEVGQRWYSARVGEGLIYDLRTEVFGHVQRQPVAFFTRAQTGSLVSRLNGDIISAQQALTSTLSGVVSNLVSLVLALAAMLWLSWPVTVAALVLIPLLVIPARLTGRRLQRLTRSAMQLDAEMGAAMTERFNVAGAMLVSCSAARSPSRGCSRGGPRGSGTSA